MITFETSAGLVCSEFVARPGPLLVMLHGIQGRKELFAALATEPFCDRYSLLIPDLPGYGISAKPDDFDYSVSSFARILESIIESTGHTDVSIIGHSLGGMIGIELLDSPLIRVEKLVSLEGNLTLADCGASKTMASLSEQEFSDQFFPDLIASLEQSTAPSAAFRLESLRLVSKRALYRSACQIVAACENDRLLDLFESSPAEKLLVTGAQSSFATVPRDSSVRIENVPGADHFMIQENYAGTVEVIGGFLVE